MVLWNWTTFKKKNCTKKNATLGSNSSESTKITLISKYGSKTSDIALLTQHVLSQNMCNYAAFNMCIL